jgi:hypothetical protein
MPTFEFTISKDVKVDAPDKPLAERALRNQSLRYPLPPTVPMGNIGEATITDDDEPRITAKRERKAKKAAKECAALTKAMDTLLTEKPPQSEVKDACAICGKDIEPGQPLQEYTQGDVTYTAHSVCAAAGGAT